MVGSLLAIGYALVITCAVSCAVVAWRARRELNVGPPIAVAALGLAVMSLSYLISSVPGTTLWHPALYPAAAGALLTTGFGGIAVGLADRRLQFRRRHLLALVEPLFITVAALADPAPDMRLGLPIAVHLAYALAYTAGAAAFVVRRTRSGQVSGRRITLAWMALLAPVICGGGSAIATALGNTGVTLSLAVTVGTVLFLGRLTWGALALFPVARSQVVNVIPDAVVVLDSSQAVVTANPAARRIIQRLNRVGEWVAGTPVADLLPGLPAFDPAGDMVFDVRAEAIDADFEVRVSPLHGRGGLAGWTLVARDVTESRRQQQALRDQLEVIDALRRDLAEQASRDPLTGLHNRRHLMGFLDQHPGAAMAVIDVDHFKRVNDEHGHPAGDRVLQQVATFLSMGHGPADLVARYGGEEFVLVMPGLTLAEAYERVDGLRRRLAAEPGPIPVTFSAGVATTIDAADQALYEAKRAGRNRVSGLTTAPGTGR
ncbi:diguanylate cyclase [Actinoplanes sp. NPDC026619]|uniref:GGDEF domain-containing protein n=1 Tax=Actinoplanes sp. NPDC026619 TaxID=3155798 RepID=UPI0033C90E82